MTNKVTLENFITIETHFGVEEHFIRADTRNKCSDDLANMLREVMRILYPDDDYDIYLLPPEIGSYKDIIKFVKKHKLGLSIGSVVAIGGLVLGFLNYSDSHEVHEHNKATWVMDDIKKCIELQKTLEDLGKDYEIENIPKEKIEEVCGNLNLKKRKNNFYNTLQRDGMVKNNEVILKDQKGEKNILSKKIEREDFLKYIEPILDKKYLIESNEGLIELISPVVRQKKEGKGISWRGTYYGDNISINDILILKDGEDVEFYMQDPDFKSQISNKEVTFAVRDNMRIVFDISGELKGGEFQNRKIYIKEVKSYNEDIIPHKERVAKISKVIPDGQITMFDDL